MRQEINFYMDDLGKDNIRINEYGIDNDYADPLPLLMGYGRCMDTGSWLGDIIGVADEMPDGYTILETMYLDW